MSFYLRVTPWTIYWREELVAALTEQLIYENTYLEFYEPTSSC